VVRLEQRHDLVVGDRGDQLGLELVAVLQRPGDAPLASIVTLRTRSSWTFWMNCE